MIDINSYKFRIYPTEEQSMKIDETFRSVKFIWNTYVAEFNKYSKEYKPNYKSTTILRNEFEFLKGFSAGALQQMERNFFSTLKQFFNKKRKKKLGRPQFKKDQSSYELNSRKYHIDEKEIYLEKIGYVEIVNDKKLLKSSDTIKEYDKHFYSCTVSKTKSGEYYVSIAVKEEMKEFTKTNKAIGIDLGLKTLVVGSTGKEFQTKKYFRKSQNRIKKLQKHLSRKKKGSNRYNKNRIKLAKTHEKVANQRKHNNHLISNELTKDFDFISLENLNVAGMKKNKRLAKSISDAGWSQLVSFLEYKAKRRGKIIQKIDRWFPSSKMCRFCGVIKEDLTLSDRVWQCDCGETHDRDLSAAINILYEGLRIYYGLENIQSLTDMEQKSDKGVELDLFLFQQLCTSAEVSTDCLTTA
jgi:putative transposase